MLPSSPLHHLLLRELDFPVVATSGNLSDEPICIDEHEALERLAASPISFSCTIAQSSGTSTIRSCASCGPGDDAAPRPRLRPAADHVEPVAANGSRGRRAFEERGRAQRGRTFSSASTSVISRPNRHTMLSRRRSPICPPLRSETRNHRCTIFIPNISRPNTRCSSRDKQWPCSIIGRTSLPAWRRMKSTRHCLASPGMELATASTARSGAANFFSSRKILPRVAHLRTFRLPGGDAAVQRTASQRARVAPRNLRRRILESRRIAQGISLAPS